MELLLPALIIFLLAFAGLSIGILFGRKGISGSCSSNEAGRLLDIQCFCGSDANCAIDACESNVSIKAVCADGDIEKCRQIQADFEARTRKLSQPKE